MGELVTVQSFVYPHDLHLAKVYLESHGIVCFVKDELTVQSYHLFSPAVGGVKLQVRQEDFLAACEILVKGGYRQEFAEESTKQLSQFERWESRTSGFPIIGKLKLEYRMTWLVLLIVLILLTAIYIVFFRSSNVLSEADLVSKSWCVERIVHHGKDYFPVSLAPPVPNVESYKQFSHVIKRIGRCNSVAYFDRGNQAYLPGFSSEIVNAKWFLNDEYLQIAHVDSFRMIYNGLYKIKYYSDRLRLKSESTTIYLYRQPQYDYLTP